MIFSWIELNILTVKDKNFKCKHGENPNLKFQKRSIMSGLPEENKSEGEKAVVSMDDLANSLGSAFNVSSKPNDPTKPHPRFTQYKSRRDFGQQEKRRRTVLDFQKSRRDDFMSVARDIASGNVLDDDELEDLIEVG
jgi:hypothetical protein